MSRQRGSRRARTPGPALLLAALVPSLAAAEAQLEVGGAVTPSAEALRVGLELRNSGDAALEGPIQVVGWLAGERSEARLDEAVAPGGAGRLELSFPPALPRPGIHALTLLVDYSSRGAAVSRSAYLLLALGAAPDPAVRLFVGEAAFELRGHMEVGLESADGAAHAVRLRVATPRGLRAEDLAATVAVPAAGRAVARVKLLRTGARHDTRHGIVVVAEAEDGPEARTSVATASVRILPAPGLLPRLRTAIIALAVVLLAASLLVELRRHRRRGP